MKGMKRGIRRTHAPPGGSQRFPDIGHCPMDTGRMIVVMCK